MSNIAITNQAVAGKVAETKEIQLKLKSAIFTILLNYNQKRNILELAKVAENLATNLVYEVVIRDSDFTDRRFFVDQGIVKGVTLLQVSSKKLRIQVYFIKKENIDKVFLEIKMLKGKQLSDLAPKALDKRLKYEVAV